MDAALTAEAFKSPAILLSGTVDYDMYNSFRAQLADAPADGLIVVELGTLGGDPEVARMMGEDVRFHSDLGPGRRFVFLGKAAIYSAGTTFMSFFARPNRYLTRGTRLMIHERKMSKMLSIEGPAHHLHRDRARCAARARGVDRDPERRLREPDPRFRRQHGRGAGEGARPTGISRRRKRGSWA